MSKRLITAAYQANSASIKTLLEQKIAADSVTTPPINCQPISETIGPLFDMLSAKKMPPPELMIQATEEGFEYRVSALYYAAAHGHKQIVNDLLPHYNHQAINKLDPICGNPLIIAAQNRSYEVIRDLLQAGAKPNIISPNFGTALMQVASLGHLDCVRILLAYRADTEQTEIDRLKPRFDYGTFACLETVKTEQETALMKACRAGHYFVVSELLRANASTTRCNRSKQNAYQIAIQSGHRHIAELIEQHEKHIAAQAKKKTNETLAQCFFSFIKNTEKNQKHHHLFNTSSPDYTMLLNALNKKEHWDYIALKNLFDQFIQNENLTMNAPLRYCQDVLLAPPLPKVNIPDYINVSDVSMLIATAMRSNNQPDINNAIDGIRQLNSLEQVNRVSSTLLHLTPWNKKSSGIRLSKHNNTFFANFSKDKNFDQIKTALIEHTTFLTTHSTRTQCL